MIVFFSPQKTAASKHNALSRVASLKPNSSVNFNLRVYSFCLWCHHNFCVSERHIPTCWSKCVFSGSKSKIVKRKTGTVVGEHNVLLRLSKQPKTLWNIPDHMTSQSAIVHIVLYLVCLSFRMQLLYRCFFLIQVHIHRSVFLMISMTRYSIIPSNLTFLCTITASSKLANSVYHSEKHPGPEGDHHRHNHHLLCILVPCEKSAIVEAFDLLDFHRHGPVQCLSHSFLTNHRDSPARSFYLVVGMLSQTPRSWSFKLACPPPPSPPCQLLFSIFFSPSLRSCFTRRF